MIEMLWRRFVATEPEARELLAQYARSSGEDQDRLAEKIQNLWDDWKESFS